MGAVNAAGHVVWFVQSNMACVWDGNGDGVEGGLRDARRKGMLWVCRREARRVEILPVPPVSRIAMTRMGNETM